MRIGRWRYVPPARSPLRAGLLVRGALGSLRPGGRLAEVESLLRHRYDADGALLTRCGTHALALAIAAAARRSGSRRVALPAYTCFDVATAAAAAECEVDFYDLDPLHLSPTLESVEDALRRGARTVVVAHLYGHPADVRGVRALARSWAATVIEDAAQAAGARLEGEPAGRGGDFTVLSFGRGKGTTCGGGGAVLARGDFASHLWGEVERQRERGHLGRGPWGARELATAVAQWALGRPELYRLPASLPLLGLGETRYREPTAPERISAFGAALLGLVLERGDDPELLARRRNGARLHHELAGVAGVQPVRPLAGGESGELRLPVLVPPRLAGGEARLGVLPGYPRLLRDVPAFRRWIGTDPLPTPGAAKLVGSLVTLPTHAGVRDSDIHAIVRWVAGSGIGRREPRGEGARA